jgi:Uma2 family endonuclease
MGSTAAPFGYNRQRCGIALAASAILKRRGVMSSTATQTLYTPEDLLTMPDGDRYELVDGRLVEHDMGARASYVGGELFYRIQGHCRANNLGWAFPADTTYQCFPSKPNQVRKPDVSFIQRGRLPGEEVPEGHIRITPDLAVEVVSPKDTYYEVEEKVAEYLKAGIRLVWVVNPPLRKVRVHRANGTVADIGEEGDLDGEDVLPGFHCGVAELFQQPFTPPQANGAS